MKRKCEHCDSEYECKRLTKKYCSDNCKQLAYFKRNGFQKIENPIVKDKDQSPALAIDSKTIQEEILNDIALKVLQLIKIREEEASNFKRQHLCKPEPFAITRNKTN